MFRKVLGLTAFAVGGIFAFKLAFGLVGFVVAVIVKIALLALLALGLYAVLKVFLPGLFGTETDDYQEEVVVEEVVEAEEEAPTAEDVEPE